MRAERRYRRRRSARVSGWNPWNPDAEVGDLVVTHTGILCRLEESSSWGARTAGVLYPRKVWPPQPGALAEIRGDEVYWTWDTEEPNP